MLLLLLLILLPAPAVAQVDGHVSVMAAAFPDVSEATGRQAVGELRTRLFVERRDDIGERWRFTLGATVDGLVGDRGAAPTTSPTTDVVIQPADLFAEYRSTRFDVRVGFARVVWGRLDEFQPTDVVNPLDLSRFLLEGRSDARLPVAQVRGRLFLGNATVVDAVVVPTFRASRFDQLEEETSPFNLLPGPTRAREEPATRLAHVQGGARLTSTTGTVDWALSAYRGFRSFPLVTLDARGLTESFPRFTMLGADFETTRGAWGVRGEVAAFVDDTLQSSLALRGVAGRTIEGGVGVDRRSGDYRVGLNTVITHRVLDAAQPAARVVVDDPEVRGTDVLLVGSAERAFEREARRIRLLGVYDPTDSTAFARLVAALSVRDNVWFEASGGLFAGSSLDTIGRLTRRDFIYARMKVYF